MQLRAKNPMYFLDLSDEELKKPIANSIISFLKTMMVLSAVAK